MPRLTAFFKRPLADQGLVVTVVMLVGVVRLALRLFGFSDVYRYLLQLQPNYTGTSPDSRVVQRIIRDVDVVSNVFLRQRPCLTRALVAQLLLSRRHYPTTLRLGVARNPDGRFEAHAWLEHEGQIVIGNLPDLNRFTPLPALEKKRI